jgi:hypothetical protein
MTPRELAEHAFVIASSGWPVFPCNVKKRPCTEHGVLDAQADPEKARSLFRSYPDAAFIAVATGLPSGIVAIDIDPAALRWFRGIPMRFPPTRMDSTPRGGYHLYYSCPHRPSDRKAGEPFPDYLDRVEKILREGGHKDPLVRCSAGKLHKGCDIRGEGGSIIVAPSPGYVRVYDAAIAPLPKWIGRRLSRKPKPKLDDDPKDRGGDLAGLVRFVEKSVKGERNARSFWAAARAGEMVRAGRVALSDARGALIHAAMRAGLDAREAQTVTMSGIKTGGR